MSLKESAMFFKNNELILVDKEIDIKDISITYYYSHPESTEYVTVTYKFNSPIIPSSYEIKIKGSEFNMKDKPRMVDYYSIPVNIPDVFTAIDDYSNIKSELIEKQVKDILKDYIKG